MNIMDIPRKEIDALLFNALRAVYQFQNGKVRLFGLNYEDIYLLQYLRTRSEVRIGGIAAELNIPVSTATRLLDRLQKKGLIQRKKDTRDRRNILISLKPMGAGIVKEVEDHTYELVTRNLRGYGADDVQSFIHTARHLRRILYTGDNPVTNKQVDKDGV